MRDRESANPSAQEQAVHPQPSVLEATFLRTFHIIAPDRCVAMCGGFLGFLPRRKRSDFNSCDMKGFDVSKPTG